MSSMSISANIFTRYEENRQASEHIQTHDSAGLPLGLQQALAAIALCVLAPLLLLTAAIIRCESPGNALFTQIRVGRYGRRFKLYKFRSMRMASDPKYVDVSAMQSDREGVCQKFFHDPRVTAVGRIIRKFSIDELPQLINVLKGDMALIGPRPALEKETDAYTLRARGRLQATPGLTGLWQVSGRADTTFEQQIDLDLSYVRAQSIWEDIRIMFATIPVVVFGRGAY